MPDVKLGNFTFEYEESTSTMYVVRVDETADSLSAVTREDWEAFRQQAMRAAEHEPEVTVELKSVRVSDHEADEAAWSVVVSGQFGDVTVSTSTDHRYADAKAQWLYACLTIVLGGDHVELVHS
jgi:hypothetical protein